MAVVVVSAFVLTETQKRQQQQLESESGAHNLTLCKYKLRWRQMLSPDAGEPV